MIQQKMERALREQVGSLVLQVIALQVENEHLKAELAKKKDSDGARTS